MWRQEEVVEVKEKESREGAAAGGAAGEVAGDDDPRAFLASMGFEEAQVRRALARFSNDTARAVEWLLSGGGGAAAAEDDDEGDNDDGFGGLAGMASTLQERDTEDAETDISGFGEQDPFGEGVRRVASCRAVCVVLDVCACRACRVVSCCALLG
jgi:hypothetical protein